MLSNFGIDQFESSEKIAYNFVSDDWHNAMVTEVLPSSKKSVIDIFLIYSHLAKT